LLGFAPDARVLIVNCDDFGMHEAVNAGVVESIENGIASSCSLMVPCPAAATAMRLLRGRPHIPFGIHLALIRDTPEYRWGPVAAKADVPSLLDPDTEELFVDTPAQRTALLAAAKLTGISDGTCRSGGGGGMQTLGYEASHVDRVAVDDAVHVPRSVNRPVFAVRVSAANAAATRRARKMIEIGRMGLESVVVRRQVANGPGQVIPRRLGERTVARVPEPNRSKCYPAGWKACLRSYFATLRPRTTPATPEKR
jgi:hypothetical protein